MGDTKHVCGASGFGLGLDDVCPACHEHNAEMAIKRETPAQAFERGRQLGMEQARREPLTDLQIEAGYAGLFARSKWQEEISFRLGCRFAERYHLITQPAGDSDTQS